MAARVQVMAQIIDDKYDGDAGRVWQGATTGAELLARLSELPGFGVYKAQILIALLGKQLGVRPDGWRAAAGTYGEDGSRYSVADISDDRSLAEVRRSRRSAKPPRRPPAADPGGAPGARGVGSARCQQTAVIAR